MGAAPLAAQLVDIKVTKRARVRAVGVAFEGGLAEVRHDSRSRGVNRPRGGVGSVGRRGAGALRPKRRGGALGGEGGGALGRRSSALERRDGALRRRSSCRRLGRDGEVLGRAGLGGAVVAGVLLGLAVEVLFFGNAPKLMLVVVVGRETQGSHDLGGGRGEGFRPLTLVPLVFGEAGLAFCRSGRGCFGGCRSGRGGLGGNCRLMHGAGGLGFRTEFGKHGGAK